jgi:tRNA A37 threonylcarbamoyladenosine biosynthesis protein TsaE
MEGYVYVLQRIVTDLIRALPGNGSVNSPTYTDGQQYSVGVF